MVGRTLLCLALLSVTGEAAASSGFLLGVDYSEWVTAATNIATDGSGAFYILSNCQVNGPDFFCVTKLSADGKTILWQNSLTFQARLLMAVDPNGGVYVIPVWQPGDTSTTVVKLTADGTGVAWSTPAGFIMPQYPVALAVDSLGRAYVAGVLDPTNQEGGVVRLNAAGIAVDYSAQVKGEPTVIAVDGSGAAFVGGYFESQTGEGAVVFLTRLAPDGSDGFYSTTLAGLPLAVAVDPSGEAVGLLAIGANGSVLQGFDSTGTVTFSKTVPEVGSGVDLGLALDAAGNAYVTGFSDNNLHPVRNSLATCASVLLSVFAPDGSVLQATYIAGALNPSFAPAIATGPNSTVFVVAISDESFVPTQAGPFPAGTFESSFLLRFSPNANAKTFPLACLGNAATFDTLRPLAPGGFVTLFGNGLGPQQGTQTQATPQSPFPTQAANVEVTFDGTPAPLLWVQDAQINVVAPWSLTPGDTTQVCVSYNGVKTNCLTWPVAQTAPAVFTVDGVYAATLNQDGTINSAGNPAAPGSIVSVFATGLGPITPPQADGTLVGLPLPNDVLPIGVVAVMNEIFGFSFTPFEVTYGGPAPYLVAGASQINFKVLNYTGSIKVNLPSTGSQPFQIYVAGQ